MIDFRQDSQIEVSRTDPFVQVCRLTQVVADRGHAPEASVTILGDLAWGKRSLEPNPPRQLKIYVRVATADIARIV